MGNEDYVDNIYFDEANIADDVRATIIVEDDGGDLFDADVTLLLSKSGVETRYNITLGELLELGNVMVAAGANAYVKFGGQ